MTEIETDLDEAITEDAPQDSVEETQETESSEEALERVEPRSPDQQRPAIDTSEVVEDLEREDLEDRYLDFKDEVWRLRRMLNLNPATGDIPSNGGYSSPGGFLRRQRVAVFVDVQNMYHSAKKTYGHNLSYAKMLRLCVGNRRLVRSIAYVIDRDGLDQISFLDHLRYCGFEIRKRPIIERADGSRKAEWELGIAMDMVRLAPKVDAIVAVSGNGVFADIAEHVRNQGVKFECCAFRESMADTLIQAVDQHHVLTEEHLY